MMKRIFIPTLCALLILCFGAPCLTAFAAQADMKTTQGDSPIARVGAYSDISPISADDELQVPQIRVVTADGNGTKLVKSDGYVDAQITITDTYGSVLSDSCSFKVHGNTTAFDSIPKKAYTFKFSKKKDVLEMGKGKKWFLIANLYDASLLRNYLAIDMAHELGLEYTSEQRFVELWVDDSFRGCYTLYEPVQEGSARVDIDIDSNDGMKDFLIEYEQLANEEGVAYFTADRWRFAVKEPEDTTDDQLGYISDTMNAIVDVMKTGDREEIARVIDIPSFVRFYLVNEFVKNMDFDMSSVYYYYKDGKLYAGPVWDFDRSCGSTNPNIGAPRATATYLTDGIIQDQRTLYSYIGRQSWFTDEVRRVYEEHYDYFENIAADNGLLDSWRDEYGDVFDRNFTVWNVAVRWTTYMNTPEPTYEGNYQFLKNWCRERNDWLSDHFDLFGYEFIRGDADGDGILDVIDVTVIQRILALMQDDADGMTAIRAAVTDGELSIIDATVIQRYLAEMGNPYELDTAIKTRLRR